jgi:hypothetical protein
VVLGERFVDGVEVLADLTGPTVVVGAAPARLGAGPAVAREPAGPDVEQGRGEAAGGEPDSEAQDDPSRNPDPEHLVQHDRR